MHYPLGYYLRLIRGITVLTACALQLRAMDPDVQPIRKTASLIAVQVWVGRMDVLAGGVPFQIQIENHAKRDLCFD
jgi:hypothetical protein